MRARPVLSDIVYTCFIIIHYFEAILSRNGVAFGKLNKHSVGGNKSQHIEMQKNRHSKNRRRFGIL